MELWHWVITARIVVRGGGVMTNTEDVTEVALEVAVETRVTVGDDATRQTMKAEDIFKK